MALSPIVREMSLTKLNFPWKCSSPNILNLHDGSCHLTTLSKPYAEWGGVMQDPSFLFKSWNKKVPFEATSLLIVSAPSLWVAALPSSHLPTPGSLNNVKIPQCITLVQLHHTFAHALLRVSSHSVHPSTPSQYSYQVSSSSWSPFLFLSTSRISHFCLWTSGTSYTHLIHLFLLWLAS